MTCSPCPSPLTWDTLLAYWLGELGPERSDQIEEHYLGCASCSQRLEQLASLADGVRTVVRASGVDMVINDQIVRQLRQDGLRVRQYRVPRNGSVNCTVAPEDDFVVACLEAPLAGARRVDLLTLDRHGNTEIRYQDIPFIAECGDVVLSTSIPKLRAMPAVTLHMRLLAVDEQGEHPLGDYTFHHMPFASPH